MPLNLSITVKQAKLNKKKYSRQNILVLLRWTEMGEFNSDDHYIYYYGQESLTRNGVAIIVNERV